MYLRLGCVSLLSVLILSACGGGGGGKETLLPPSTSLPSPGVSVTPRPQSSSPPTTSGSGNPSWQQGVFEPASNFKSYCELPRSGTDLSGQAYTDQQGSELHEKLWLRSWTNNTYLWYNEVSDLNPASFTVEEYFAELRSKEVTASGESKDKFHFTYPTDAWQQLSESGVSSGYGMQLAVDNDRPSREIRVAYVEPGSPAAIAGIGRGAYIVEVDGVNVTDNTTQGLATLNAGLSPSETGETHFFAVRDLGSSLGRFVTLISENIESSPVLEVSTLDLGDKSVGYLVFNDHVAPAETALIDAISELRTEGVDELVLDLRYNGGGYLVLAAQLAYMVSGRGSDDPIVFDLPIFNDKHPTINPVTGRRIAAMPFVPETVGLSEPAGRQLPTLALDRVVIITDGGTCSASEALINGLSGAGVDVVLVGGTTCGKPYGFYPQDNCGTSYFSIQFKGVNALGFGDYSDGFAPAGTGAGTIEMAGCRAADDLEHPLGDSNERLLSNALSYIDTGTCTPLNVSTSQSKSSAPAANFELLKQNPFRTNAIWTY
ncbi:S41 family peptidase [Agaribacterium sp. ZY112]|uniref:S41 family peptidase n=1 Tax=Agaribacterium sp. ZY112 TaxID=3233574 RepID=UPI003525093E